ADRLPVCLSRRTTTGFPRPHPPRPPSPRCSRSDLGVKSQEIVHPGALCKAGCRQTTKPAEEATRMNIHKNARTTPHSRARIAGRVAAGERPAGIARDVGVCDRTVKKWVARAAEGELALEDRSCR